MLKNHLKKLFFAIDIKQVPLNIVALTGGYQHQLWKVRCKNNTWVVKKINPLTYQSKNTIREIEKTEQLAYKFAGAFDFCVSAISHHGAFIHPLNGEYFLIYPYIEGTHVYLLNQQQAFCLGEKLALLHHSSVIKPVFPLPDKRYFSLDRWYLTLQSTMFFKECLPMFGSLSILYKQVMEANRQYQGGYVVSHCDLNLANILWCHERQPCFIDWECAGNIVPGVELIHLAFNAAGIANQHCVFSLWQAVIEGYNSVHALPVMDENIYLQAYYSWFAWLDFCLQKINDTPAFKKPVQHAFKALELIQQFYQQAFIHLKK